MTKLHRTSIGALVIVGALLLSVAAAVAGSVTLRVATLEAPRGSTVGVPIEVVGAGDVGAMHIELVYDPAVLTLDTVTPGPLAGEALLDSGADKPGRLVISLATLKAIKGDGTLATARFRVVGQEGQQSALNLESTAAWEEATLRQVLVKSESGSLRVGGRRLPWWLLGVAAVLLLLLLLLLLLIVVVIARRKKQPAGEAARTAASQGAYCSSCGKPNASGAKFCSHCGAPLPSA